MHRRIEDLWIFAPKGLAEIITIQLKYSDTRLNFKIHFTETQTEKSYLLFENENVTITTIPLIHRVPCCGFLFREKSKKRKIVKNTKPSDLTFEEIKMLKDGEDIINADGSVKYKNENYTIPSLKSCSYAFCSDTLFNESIIDIVKNVDLLYHEATFLDELLPRATQTNHSTTKQAALIAKKAKVGKLIIGHYSSRYKELETHLAEAREVFMNSYLAIEGETHKIRDIKV